MRVSNNFRWLIPCGFVTTEPGETINQPASAPVHQFLARAAQTVFATQRSEQLSGHGRRPMMILIQNVPFCEQLLQSTRDRVAGGVCIGSEIGMMNESPATGL